MALADRHIEVTQRIGRIDAILAGIQGDLPQADRDWLKEHLTATGPQGNWIYPADRIAEAVTDEYPHLAISPTLVRDWRRGNGR